MTHPLESRRRRVGRLALYGSLLTTGLIVGSVLLYLNREHRLRADQLWTEVDWAEHLDVQVLRDYVRIDTSPTGSELRGARFLAAHFEAAGIPHHIESLGDGKANFWAILEGEERDALVLHHHIDVSPIGDPDEWVHPPFAGVIEPPHLLGRGSFDMKSIAVAQMLAMLDLAKTHPRPQRSVIFLATSSEESGSELGTQWILREHPRLVERFWAVLTEGGVIEPLDFETIKYWGIEFAQKRFALGAACHAERERLEDFKRDFWLLNDHWTPPLRSEELERFRTAYGPTRAQAYLREIVPAPWDVFSRPENFWRLPRFLRAGFRDEIAFFDVEESPDGGYRLPFALHLAPTSSLEQARRQLLPDWATAGMTIQLSPPEGAAHGSPIDHPAYLELTASLRERFPETHVGPYFLAWSATDARYFREAGIPAYGFAPFPIFSLDTFRVDAANEEIGLPGFVRGIEIYRDVVRRLAAAPTGAP